MRFMLSRASWKNFIPITDTSAIKSASSYRFSVMPDYCFTSAAVSGVCPRHVGQNEKCVRPGNFGVEDGQGNCKVSPHKVMNNEKLDRLLEVMVEYAEGISDLLFVAGRPMQVETQGELMPFVHELSGPELTSERI